MSNATDPIFPVADWGACQLPGLTKRELFAAMAMQSALAGAKASSEADLARMFELIAGYSVRMADALLAELAK